MLQMLHTILSLDGFEVTVCGNGVDGVRLVEEARPDLILLDVMMPGKGGLEVMMDVRANPAIKDIPILFLSAVGEEAVIVQGLKGADDYVLKPFRTLELEARIRKILSRTSRGAREVPKGTEQVPERLAVEVGDETYLVPLDHIYYFEASGKYAYAHTRDRRFLTGFSIGELEEKLKPAGRFLRIHRSFVVNTDVVQKITSDERKSMAVVMADEQATVLRVSGSYLASVKGRLGL